MSHLRPSERLHALDAVRAFALLLGIALHASMSFLPGIPIWATQDVSAATGFNFVFYVPHMFRMVLFFFIAGFFARLAFNRRGLRSFALDRFKRIAVPFVSLWFPLFAAIAAVFIWGFIKANGGVIPEDSPPPPPVTLESLPLTHMWFLWLLLIFYVVALALHDVVALVDRKGSMRALLDRIVRPIAATPLFALLAGAPLAAWFWFNPGWMAYFGIPTPDIGFIPNNGALIGYGVAFGLGWVIHRQIGILTSWKRWWPINLVLAVAATWLCVNIIGVQPGFMPMEQGQEKLIYAVTYAVGGWCWTLGLTGLAMQLLSGHNPVVRYVADSSYWLYLMHLPLVMALQVLVSDIALPGIVKFGLINLVTLTILLASYHWLVRRTWVGAWLNGKRAPGRTDAQTQSAQTTSASPAA